MAEVEVYQKKVLLEGRGHKVKKNKFLNTHM